MFRDLNRERGGGEKEGKIKFYKDKQGTDTENLKKGYSDRETEEADRLKRHRDIVTERKTEIKKA